MNPLKEKISLILYQDGTAPKYYTLSKSLIRTTLTVLPIVSFIAIATTMVGIIYFNEIRHSAKRKEPAVIKKLREKQSELESSLKSVILEKSILQDKINQGVNSKDGPGFLSLFKKSLGRQDKTTSPETALEDIRVYKDGPKLKFYFKLINLTKPVRRINGHVFVIMQTNNQISIWPQNTFKDQSIQVSFSDGEYFGTSRFRPFEATFKTPNATSAVFKIAVFDKSGDFIFKQIVAKDF
jgi:hypothetical protein